jgi:hypothetical protein
LSLFEQAVLRDLLLNKLFSQDNNSFNIFLYSQMVQYPRKVSKFFLFLCLR